MEKPTKRQQAVLEIIRRVLDREGVPPTTREIARQMALDPKSVAQHLDRLERKGYISRRPRESRNIRLTERAGAGSSRLESSRLESSRLGRGVPLVGQIAAGQPLLAEENIEDHVEMDRFFGPEESVFLLRVQGESMKGAGIRDKDLAAVLMEGEVRDGDIAVVSIDGEATVKRFYRNGPLIRLEPENPAYETIMVDTDRQEARVVGRVVGLVRRMK
jgi:repressor LexA